MKRRSGLLALWSMMVLASSHAFAAGVAFQVDSTPLVAGNSDRRHEARPIGGANAITVDAAIDLFINEGATSALEIDADSNLLPLIRTTLNNGELKITATGGYSSARPLTARITLPALTKLSVRGPGDVDMSGLQDDTIEVAMSGAGDLRLSGHPRILRLSSDGSGDIELTGVVSERIEAGFTGSGEVRLSHIQTDVLALTLNGSGDLEANGTVEDLDLTINGSGEFIGVRLPARRANIVMHGSGSAQVRVSRELVALVSGSGSLDVTGAPTRKTLTVNGSGTLKFHK